MNPTKEAALLMSSLSIFQGIRNRSVPKAYYELLCSVNKPVFEFTTAWGRLFALLSERGYANNLAGCITETALFDENAFSRAAAAGEEKHLPTQVISAIRRDLSAIRRISLLSPETILNDYTYRIKDIE